MQKRIIQVGLAGMNQDVINPKVNTLYAYEIKNFRINSTGHSNGIELTSERGTLLVNIYDKSIEGDLYTDFSSLALSYTTDEGQTYPYADYRYKVIGHCVLNDYIVVFLHGAKESDSSMVNDQILRLQLDDLNGCFINNTLYCGNLGFDDDHKIECIPYMESTNIQKVYWIDGINYPRVINIVREGGYTDFDVDEDPFSFYQLISSGSYNTIDVSKSYVGGLFYAGVIQYAFSFYNKNALETPVIYTTPLNYISHSDRGEVANKQLGCAFNVTVKINIEDHDNFEYVRVYSIYRSSINGTPVVKVIKDVRCENMTPFYAQPVPIGPIKGYYIEFTDTNEQGYDFDAYRILINSDHIKPNAIGYKDQKMFLGNYGSDIEIEDPKKYELTEGDVDWLVDETKSVLVKTDDITFYPYKNQNINNSNVVKTFKHGEHYKLGFQLQDKYGNWGLIFFYKDSENTEYPSASGNEYYLPYAKSGTGHTISDIFGDEDLSDYVKIRTIVSYPTFNERSILCQGVINPTVFNAQQRHDKTCYAQSSWFFRPFKPTSLDQNEKYVGFVQNSNDYPLYGSTTELGELLNMYFDGSEGLSSGHLIIEYNQTEWCDNTTDFELGCNGTSPFGIEGFEYLENGPYSISYDGGGPLGGVTHSFYGDPAKFTTTSYGSGTVIVYDIIVYSFTNPNGYNFEHPEVWNPGSLSWGEHIEPDHTESSYFAEEDYQYEDENTTIYSKRPIKKYSLFQNDDFDTYSSFYYVDQSIVTVNSPDLQFDENIKNVDLSQYKIRKVGLVNFKNLASKYNIIAESPLFLNNGTVDAGNTTLGLKRIRSSLIAKGFYNRVLEYKNGDSDGCGGAVLSNGLYWLDDIHNIFTWDTYVNSGWNDKDALYLYAVYPWQRQYLNNWNGNKYEPTNTSSNGSKAGVTDESESSKIIRKVLSNIRYCDTIYTSSSNLNSLQIKLYDSKENTAIKLDDEVFYYGNVDQLVTCTSMYDGIKFSYQDGGHGGNVHWELNYNKNGYPIVIGRAPYYGKPPQGYETYNNISGWIGLSYWAWHDPQQHNFIPMNEDYSSSTGWKHNTPSDSSTDPIMIRYKSAEHIVCELGTSSGGVNTLVPITGDNASNSDGYLYLAEIYKDYSASSNDTFDLQNRTWVPCGEPMNLFDASGNLSSDQLVWTEGDTYFQRYDCLKTYPYSNDDYQSVVEIASFMVETHINLDGRYDENRGLIDNTFVNPTNFNLINPVYSQTNNFFQYNVLDEENFKTTDFPTRFTWSLNKVNGLDIDEWTRTNTSAFYDCDGDKGELTSLRRFNGLIYAFQEKGISRIKYNENVAINTNNGTPIELANSLSVNGVEYLSEFVGSQNKWSNISTPNGVFFVDNYTPGIYRLGGGERVLTNLTKNVLQRWFESNNTNHDFINTASFDANMNEIHFMFDNESLAYNNDFGTFSSFYDYKGWIGNIKNHSFNITDNKMYFLREGLMYNTFYGNKKPYWIEFVANSNIDGYSPSNAIYDNVWYNADVLADAEYGVDNMNYDEIIEYTEDKIPRYPDGDFTRWYETFTKIEAGNDYQYGKFDNNPDEHTQTKNFKFIKKFRTWRVPVPRNQIGIKSGNLHRDRMRNQWLRVKLTNTNPSTNKMVLRDIYVDSFF